jgi:hypothetical protein
VDRAGTGRDAEDTRTAWTFLADDPSLDALTIGPAPGVEPGSAARLPPGRYRFELSYREQRRFGPVVISRDASTSIPFRIQY